MIIKIKFRFSFLKRRVIFYFLFNFRESVCSWVIFVRFITEFTKICECCYINLRRIFVAFDGKFFIFALRLLGLLLLLHKIYVSLAFDLAFKIPEYRCDNTNQRKNEIDQNRGKQEAGQDPGDLQLEIR